MLALALSTFALPTFAQEPPAPVSNKWRPKDGVYAAPGKDFKSSCDEANDITIELGDKSVNGYEWGCNIKQLLDLAPDSLKLEMICSDYNLAQNINSRDPNWENRLFKETMFIKRIDATTISIQKTLNGKLKDPPWRAAYCPAKTQRLHIEAKLEAKEQAKRKAEEERALKNAHPRDGIYAAAGADFEDRCAKFNDTIVAFAGKSISTASNKCRINNTRVQLPDTVRIGGTCALQPASSPDAGGAQNGGIPSDYENMMFKKIDDKTVILWIINDGHFTGEGRKLTYCSDLAQRAYARQHRADKPAKN
jgi:hypothetical protein